MQRKHLSGDKAKYRWYDGAPPPAQSRAALDINYILDSSNIYSYVTIYTESFNINMQNIQEIRIVSGDGYEGCRVYGLQFIERNGNQQRVMHLPIWIGSDGPTTVDELKQTQIFRAFERLRVLSGGPAPLRF